MRELLESTLASMNAAAQNDGDVKEADLASWQEALATLLIRYDEVEQAAREVIDSYLMRPAPSASRGKKPSSSRSQHLKRLAAAMAALEATIAGGS